MTTQSLRTGEGYTPSGLRFWRAAARFAVAGFACPQCGAVAGDPCFDTHRTWGHVQRDDPHTDRLLDGARFVGYER